MQQLAARLTDDGGPDGAKVDASEVAVISLGVPGDNAHNALAVLQTVVPDLGPDVVLYVFTNNDHCLPASRRREEAPSHRRLLLVDLLLRAKGSRLGAGDLVEDRWWTVCSPDDAPPALRHQVGPAGLSNTLRGMAEWSKTQAVPVGIFPSLNESDRPPKPDLHGLPVLSPARDLAAARAAGMSRSELRLSTTDLHPSVVAHALLAGALHSRLREVGWLPSRSRPRESHEPSVLDGGVAAP